MTAKQGQHGKGHTSKHTGTTKHTGTAKHNPKQAKKSHAKQHPHHKSQTTGHHPKPTKRGLAIGDTLPCCSAEALATSLRLLGGHVGALDVLGLYQSAATSERAGTSILAALEAASRSGLAGRVPDWRPVSPVSPGLLILGVTLDGGPHAIVRDPDGGCWSWGQPWDLPAGIPVEEAWEVSAWR